MSGQQQVVAAGGAALIVVAAWTGDVHKSISKGLFHSGAKDSQIQDAHEALIKLAGAVLLVAVATIAAGVSKQWGTVMVTMIGGLLLLLAINRAGGGLAADVPNLGAGRRQGTAGPGQRVPVTS